MVSEKPKDHVDFLRAFSGVRDIDSNASGFSVRTERGDIRVMNPAAYRAYSGTEPPSLTRGARFAAIRFGMSDKRAVISALKKGGVVFVERDFGIVVPPDAAFGATLIFDGTKVG
jgi:hypothetical protein